MVYDMFEVTWPGRRPALIAEDTVNICVLKDTRPVGAFSQPGEVYLGIKVFWKDVFS